MNSRTEHQRARLGNRALSPGHRQDVSCHDPDGRHARAANGSAPVNGEVPAVVAGEMPVIGVRRARSWWQRARGLIGHPPPLPGRGMYFDGTAAVHGIGMAHALDVVFLDASHRVVRCARLPRLGMRACLKARAVLELRAGEIARLGIEPGMSLTLLDDDEIFGVQS